MDLLAIRQVIATAVAQVDGLTVGPWAQPSELNPPEFLTGKVTSREANVGGGLLLVFDCRLIVGAADPVDAQHELEAVWLEQVLDAVNEYDPPDADVAQGIWANAGWSGPSRMDVGEATFWFYDIPVTIVT